MIRSVRRTATFEALRTSPRRGVSATCKLSATDLDDVSDPQNIELAFAIGRRFGTAVERNRARRRLRAAVRQVVADGAIEPGAYLLVPKRRALSANFDELVLDVRRCAERAATGRQMAGAGEPKTAPTTASTSLDG